MNVLSLLGRRSGLTSRWVASVLAIAVLGAAGCGAGDTPGIVKVYPVKGRVVLAGGQPLRGGHIYFVPKDDGLIVSSAAIDRDGAFSLTTGDSGEGAPPGQFKVRIEPEEPTRAVAPTRRRGTAKSRLPFPSKYTDEDASGLLVTIEPRPNDLGAITLK